MTKLGLIFMAISWCFIIGLMIFSYTKILVQDCSSENDE